MRRCIDSILAQTYTDYELILVDDGSSDKSGLICDDYAEKDQRIKVFHQANQGQASARNHALDWIFENSNSKYISFVDSDDWIHPRFLELLHKGINRYDVNICQCGHLETDGADKILNANETMLCITPDEQFVKYYSAFMWDKLFSRSCWERLRFPENQIYEDVAIWYKILFAESKIAIVNDVLYYYYQRSNNTTNGVWTPQKFTQITAWKEQIDYFEQHENRYVLCTATRRFCWVLVHQYKEICNSNKITKLQRLYYKTKVKNKLRRVVLGHKCELKELGEYAKYYDFAFPIGSWIFWTWYGIKGKITRMFQK